MLANALRTTACALACTLGTVATAAQTATYQVPTPYAPELEAVNTMPLEHVSARLREDGRIRVKYFLPRELDGNERLQLDLNGTMPVGEQTAELHGESLTPDCVPTGTDGEGCVVESSATCSLAADESLTCAVHYENLTVDSAGAERFLRSQNLSEARIGQMLQVGASLQHQAQGIVTIPAQLLRRD
jgi:hypothetical protein